MSNVGQIPPKPPVIAIKKGDKAGDSLGNPDSPGGANSWGKLVAPAPEAVAAPATTKEEKEPSEHLTKPLRLQLGWEALLLAQRSICSKAQKILDVLEAPRRYFAAKRTKSVIKRANGIILDFDAAEKEPPSPEKAAAEGAASKKPEKDRVA